MKIGVLTISDRAANGLYEDKSGPLIADILERRTGWEDIHQAVVADNISAIKEVLITWSDAGMHLILTTGGTGLSPRDMTPEATREIIEKEVPGIPEALRSESLKITRHAMLSRATAGVRKSTLIINLPGNPKAVKENLEILLPVLPHALELLGGSTSAESGHRTV